MKLRNLLLLALAGLHITFTGAQTSIDNHFIYFADGSVEAYPKEYVKTFSQSAEGYELTLIDGTKRTWAVEQVDSVSDISPVYPRFTDFKLDDKLNDQLFYDIDGRLDNDSVNLIVGAIGKWLTPSFKTDSKIAEVYIGKDIQTSGQSRRRFAEDMTYTLSLPGHRRLAMEKVSEEVWSEPTAPISEIPLTTDMLSTNAPSGRNQGLDKMLDNDPTTFFHSTYSGDPVYDVLPTDKFPYITVTLDKAVGSLKFYYLTRHDTSERSPHAFKVYVSNDNASWTEVAEFDASSGIPTAGKSQEFTSPVIELKQAYKYWRFEQTACSYKNYLCLAEFRLYEVTGKAGEPELIQPAKYAYTMLPLGREVPIRVDWLTDHAEVPRIDINIEGGKFVTSKEYYLNAEITIQGQGVWPDFQDVVQIKGRGNSSWGAAKKPYRLKFASSVKPFGLKKGKNWNLIAQAQTGSLLSNPVAMKIARMTGTAAANDVVPVDLYMNGSYMGSYMFTQKVGLANNSVDLEDETQAVLIELDSYSETGQFRSNNYNLPVNIKSPEFGEDETVLSFSQIRTEFNNFITDIYNDANYERHLDIDKLVRFMLVNELVLNAELGHPKSTFLYRENMNHLSSQYTFGPVWDFDWGYGYEGTSTYCMTDPTEYYFNRHPKNPGRTFFMKLWEESEWIKYYYYQVWKDFMDNHLEELIDYIDNYHAYARNSFRKNSNKWSDGYNYSTNVANMKSWIEQRAHHIMDSLTPYDGVKVPYHFADSNSDGSLDTKDIDNMVSYMFRPRITDRKLKIVDIDANGELTVNDIAWMCELAENTVAAQARRNTAIDEWSIDVEDEGEDRDADEIYTMPDNYQTRANETRNSTEKIAFSVTPNTEKGGWDIAVSMNNNTPYIALQVDFTLPTGLAVSDDMSDISLSPRMEATHTITNAYLQDGTYRVIAYSPDNAEITDQQGVLFTLTVIPNRALSDGTYTLTAKNIRLSTAKGIEEKVDDITASIITSDLNTIEHTPQWPADIYDLSGRLVRKSATSLQGLHQGTYIVNQQKVIVK